MISDTLQNQTRTRACFCKWFTHTAKFVLGDIVAENDDNLVTFCEIFAQFERIGDTAFALLIRIVNVF